MGLLTSGGGTPQRLAPPSLNEVLTAIAGQPDYVKTAKWAEANKDDLVVIREVIADFTDPPRFIPLIGPAQVHHAHYRVSLRSEQDGQTRVVFVDHNHVHTMKVAAVSIQAGSPPFEAIDIDEQLRGRLKDWDHSVELFGPVDIDSRGESVELVATPVWLRLHFSPAIRFHATGQELTVRFTPDRTLAGTIRGDVHLTHAGEFLRCDSLTFSSDGEVIASGNVKLRGAKKKTDGQLRLDDKPLGVTKETVLQRLPSGKSPIVDFVAEEIELDLNENTVTVRPKSVR